MAVPFAATFVHPAQGWKQAPYFPLGGLFPRPEPDLFPVVEGPFVGRGFAMSISFSLIHSSALQLNVAWQETIWSRKRPTARKSGIQSGN